MGNLYSKEGLIMGSTPGNRSVNTGQSARQPAVAGTIQYASNPQTTQKQNGGWYGGVQYWADGQNPGQNNNVTGDSGGDGGYNGGDIDALYEPALRATYDAENNINTGTQEDIAGLERNYQNEYGKTQTEKGNLLTDTSTAQSAFEKTLRSALSEALRAYNALQQQTRARFGMGNSAGQAVGELAQQEFFRQQGAVGEKGVEGSAQFETEKSRIGQFVAQKVKDLDNYKLDAMDQIKKNLRTQLAEVAARRTDIESNKTRDKMAILQDNMNRARQIESEAKSFRQSLALAAVQQLQTISGGKFNPQEIVAYVDDIINNRPTIGGTTSAPTTTLAYNRKPSTKTDEDQLQGL